jgi:hypothetical protein
MHALSLLISPFFSSACCSIRHPIILNSRETDVPLYSPSFLAKKYPQSLRFSAVTPFASASSAKFLVCLKKERAASSKKMLLPFAGALIHIHTAAANSTRATYEQLFCRHDECWRSVSPL